MSDKGTHAAWRRLSTSCKSEEKGEKRGQTLRARKSLVRECGHHGWSREITLRPVKKGGGTTKERVVKGRGKKEKGSPLQAPSIRRKGKARKDESMHDNRGTWPRRVGRGGNVIEQERAGTPTSQTDPEKGRWSRLWEFLGVRGKKQKKKRGPA